MKTDFDAACDTETVNFGHHLEVYLEVLLCHLLCISLIYDPKAPSLFQVVVGPVSTDNP